MRCPVRLVHVERRDLLGRSRDTQEDVDLAERPDARLPEALERGDVADVRRHAQRLAAARLDLGRDLLDQRLAPPGRDDVGAGIREAERQRAADAARAAHDHCHASRKIEQAHRREAGLRVPRALGGGGPGAAAAWARSSGVSWA